ncbi:DUF2071 domain-containing protein [Psychrobacillus sp. FSL W7-1457]|uniref:YqjF family protein n=1 Tax=unclassified Psychrobacillus TaxID=2636677 RepID=UPI0030FA33A2
MNSKKDKWDASHRSWPLPKLPWTMTQTWNDLLFAHYPIDINVLRQLVPNGLALDTFNGKGWIGVVPFHMTNIRLRGTPRVPGTDSFAELNVRTYVTVNGKPGVFFFSLDAENLLAVKVAQTIYHLPYMHADMKVEKRDSFIEYTSKRRHGVNARFECSYRPISDSFYAKEGSFEEWLTERYCLYTLSKKGEPLRCDILHERWLLQQAEADIRLNTMLSEQGIQVEGDEPVLHYSRSMEVRMWPLVSALNN